MTLPKHAAIADDLRRRISDGEFGPGDRLPTLEEIQDHYGVSRGTAMEGVNQLEALGIVERRLGRGGGNFVRHQLILDIYAWRDDQPMHTSSESDLFHRTVREQQRKPSQDFSVRVEPMPEEFCALLNIETSDTAVVRRCVRKIDGIPHSIQDSWYPSWLCERVPMLRQEENIEIGTTRLLAAEGFAQVAARAYATAAMPTADEASILRIPPTGLPVLHSVLTGYTAEGPLRISAAVFGPGTRLVSEHGDIRVIDRFRP